MKIASTIAAAVAALTMTATAGAHIFRPGCNARLASRAELACARLNREHALETVAWARDRQKTLVFLDVGATRRLGQIIRDHRWLYRVMTVRVSEAERRIAEARRKVAASAWPPHHQLWLCIHGGEGAWNDQNSGGNGHWGGLQMHWDWGYGIVGDAGNYSQMAQEWAAENGYRASGYSSGFLWQQWAADARCFA